MEILTNIPIDLTPERIFKRLRMRQENETIASSVREWLETVRPIVNAKAVYDISYVDNKNGNSMDIDGIEFTSRILRVNLDEVNRVFPYVVTCGREIDGITVPGDDIMQAYILDAIKEVALYLAFRYLEKYLIQSFALEEISRMAPGELEDWPITQQRALFSIFGNVEELIGVKLTNSCLMTPIKSTSGIMYHSEERFEGCQLCPMEKCFNRKVPYDPALFEKYKEKALDSTG